MIIAPQAAKAFISGYTRLLTQVHLQSNGGPNPELVQILAAARQSIVESPSLIDAAAAALDAKGPSIAKHVLDAIKTIQLKHWIFLRDTSRYSVFLDPDGKAAYAVLGLTDHTIVGGSAVAFTTGVVAYRGHYVCDGIIGKIVWLGPNMKKTFNATLSVLRKSGGFHTSPSDFGVRTLQC
jgi:hypothetical protein